MADLSDIPDEAVEAGARAAYAKGAEWDKLDGTTKAIELRRARLTLRAALPVLNTANRPRLVSGDIPVTERTPHGAWIADGPDPEPSLAVPCGGLSGCDDCGAYNELRQHLVEQIIALDEQHQREMTALSASRDSETADLLRAAVFEISHLRAAWVNTYVDRAQKAWRGGSWRSRDADRAEREAIAKWNADHPGLIALWKAHEIRAASLRGEQGE